MSKGDPKYKDLKNAVKQREHSLSIHKRVRAEGRDAEKNTKIRRAKKHVMIYFKRFFL